MALMIRDFWFWCFGIFMGFSFFDSLVIKVYYILYPLVAFFHQFEIYIFLAFDYL